MPTSHWFISLSLVHMKGKKTQTNNKKIWNTHTHLDDVIYWVSSDGKQGINRPYRHSKPHHQMCVCHGSAHTLLCLSMTSMALLEPSCSPGTALPSQQCSNSLLKQKDMASLGVIKPIKNHLGLIYALLNHMIEILWSAVSQTLGKAWPAISSTSQWEMSLCCSCLYLSSQINALSLLKKAGTPFLSARTRANNFDYDTELKRAQ